MHKIILNLDTPTLQALDAIVHRQGGGTVADVIRDVVLRDLSGRLSAACGTRSAELVPDG